MHIVDRIFAELGESTSIARETGVPVQTANSWKVKGNIPHWRRQSVIEAAHRLGKTLDPEMAAYLASASPAPRKTEAA